MSKAYVKSIKKEVAKARTYEELTEIARDVTRMRIYMYDVTPEIENSFDEVLKAVFEKSNEFHVNPTPEIIERDKRLLQQKEIKIC